MGEALVERSVVDDAASAMTPRGPSSQERAPGIAPLDDDWYTGTLLSFPAQAIPAGHAWVGTYLSATRTHGAFAGPWSYRAFDRAQRSDSVTSAVDVMVGIGARMDLTLAMQGSYNGRASASSFAVGDTSLRLGYQILEAREGSERPDVMLTVRETFPTGKSSGLDPRARGADASGSGAFETAAGIIVERSFASRAHPLKLRANVTYAFVSGARVQGPSVYGTGLGAAGVARPGHGLQVLVAAEYHVTRAWVLAVDAYHVHAGKTRFTGDPGAGEDGPVASPGSPASEQLSVAPAVEYNINGNWGLSAGVWATIVGRNQSAFVSPTIAVSTYY